MIEICVCEKVAKKERGEDFEEQEIGGGNESVDRCSVGVQ
jgi:hypothetical protein